MLNIQPFEMQYVRYEETHSLFLFINFTRVKSLFYLKSLEVLAHVHLGLASGVCLLGEVNKIYYGK